MNIEELLAEASRMKRRDIKDKAQDFLMHALGTAFYAISDDPSLSLQEKEEISKEADKQMRRVEKLFGYVPGSWGRG